MWVNLSKLFFAMMLLYSSYIQYLFFSISGLAALLGLLSLFFLLIAIYRQATPLLAGIGTELILWTVFAITSLFAGYFVAVDVHQLISSVFLYCQYLIMIAVICFISVYDDGIDFIVAVMTVLAFICAVTTIFWGVPFGNSEQITMGAFMNPNASGLLMVFGMFGLLYRLDIHNKLNILLVTSGIIMFLYTVILSASRKSFLAATLLLMYWFAFCLQGVIGKISLGKKVLTVAALVLIVTFSFYLLAPFFQDSFLVSRFTTLASEGDENRILMYKEALEYFKSSPLFGVGFNNFRLLSATGTISHSTYAEVLACTGLLGTFLYLGAYITMAAKIIRILVSKSSDDSIGHQARLILGIFLVMVLLGTGVIHFYNLNFSIILATMVAFVQVHNERKSD